MSKFKLLASKLTLVTNGQVSILSDYILYELYLAWGLLTYNQKYTCLIPIQCIFLNHPFSLVKYYSLIQIIPIQKSALKFLDDPN